MTTNSDLDPNPAEDTSFINDIREDFRCISFSGYKMTQVKTQIIENMLKQRIEQSIYWSSELICSGHFLELWESIFMYYGKYIYLGNAKLAVYLDKRYQIFKNIMEQSIFTNILQLRNNEKIRKLFAEIIFILCISPKKHCIEYIKINRVEEFDITQMTERLKAPTVEYIVPFFQKKDPYELIIALNEFSYNISKDSFNTIDACYWIEWFIEFDLICKSKKQPCHCERRLQYKVENKYQMDVIWLIWDSLLFYCKSEKNEFIQSIMNSLLHLFCVKYTSSTAKKRRYILYMAVGLMTEHVNCEIEIINKENKDLLKIVIENINIIYKDIKKNEKNPKMNYLFSGLQNDKKKNIENSLKKMEMMNQLVAPEMKEPTELYLCIHSPDNKNT
jgi:hypothetical protein